MINPFIEKTSEANLLSIAILGSVDGLSKRRSGEM